MCLRPLLAKDTVLSLGTSMKIVSLPGLKQERISKEDNSNERPIQKRIYGILAKIKISCSDEL